jgi:hypothetical protein
MFCSNCGKEIPENSNYCLYCGVLLSGKGLDKIIKTSKGKTLVVVNSQKSWSWALSKIKIFIDGDFIKEVKNGGSISIEIDNGKHIIFCESSWCKRSDAIEITANSNELYFSAAFPPMSTSLDYKITLTKIKETEEGTWE